MRLRARTKSARVLVSRARILFALAEGPQRRAAGDHGNQCIQVENATGGKEACNQHQGFAGNQKAQQSLLVSP